jgi:hypothetical protein
MLGFPVFIARRTVSCYDIEGMGLFCAVFLTSTNFCLEISGSGPSEFPEFPGLV